VLPADRDRLSAEFRIIALLDRRVEGVHVDMDDLPHSLPSRFRALVRGRAYGVGHGENFLSYTARSSLGH
jgi:hypothetical protein